MQKIKVKATQTIPVILSPRGGSMLGQLVAQAPRSACLSLCALAFQASQQDVCGHKLAPQTEQWLLGHSCQAGATGATALAVLAPQRQPGFPPVPRWRPRWWELENLGVLFSLPFAAHPPVDILWKEELSSLKG